MLSGPDLGAGFLFQLTLDRLGADSRFVYHAQDGGADANGPPKGDPGPLGWRAAEGLCPFGGRRCWHREFWLPDSEAMRVRTAYNRTRFVMEASIDQIYDRRPVPAEESLVLLLGRVPPDAPPWVLSGAMALVVRGSAIAPRSIEIDTNRDGVRGWAEALEEYVIEPPARTTGRTGATAFAARAFVGTLRDGTRVEWTDRARPGPGGQFDRGGHDLLEWKGQRLAVRSPSRIRAEAADEGRPEIADAASALRR